MPESARSSKGITVQASVRYPGCFCLTPDVQILTRYLARQDWLEPGEMVDHVERAGDGNMNCVLRVRTSHRSFILKQSVPWVEKYPHIAAPWDRALVEAGFYQTVADRPEIAVYLPRLFATDPEDRVLMIEDLGSARDFAFLYSGNGAYLEDGQWQPLIGFLVALHSFARSSQLAVRFSNREMRQLNHEHVFALPLRTQNGLDLNAITPGLLAVAQDLKENDAYVRQVGFLGARYLDTSRGECLLHGDYFPGSWLQARQRVYVIDPEFCFYGPPAWDIGVMVAHLFIAGCGQSLIDQLLKSYAASVSVDFSLVWQFAGVEIMRRLIGVAQLPVTFGLERKAELLEISKQLVLRAEPA